MVEVEAAGMGRRPDVVLAGVPKSGTSMLCNAMTVAGRTVVLYEPTRGRFRAERLQAQAASLGYHGHNILGWARKHEKWGVKEVLANPIRKALDWGPERVVLLVRDLRHVALSTFETNQRIPWDLDYRRRRLIDTARMVMELASECPQKNLFICNYEEFVSKPEYREAFRLDLNWPTLDGDVARGLSTWLERPHEAARHGGRITPNSVSYRRTCHDPEPERFADEIMLACPSFNAMFGYER
jgi:hypothetical protein